MRRCATRRAGMRAARNNKTAWQHAQRNGKAPNMRRPQACGRKSCKYHKHAFARPERVAHMHRHHKKKGPSEPHKPCLNIVALDAQNKNPTFPFMMERERGGGGAKPILRMQIEPQAKKMIKQTQLMFQTQSLINHIFAFARQGIIGAQEYAPT